MAATAELLFRVDRESDLPIGLQIAWRIRALIAAGRLAPGEQLPSVRELAEEAGINPNTARTVYGRLEEEGLLASRHGSGTFVAADVSSSAEVERIAAEAVGEARRRGIAPREVARAIYAGQWAEERSSEPLPDVGTEADEAAARRELRRQIARLEAELAAYPEVRSANATHPLLRPKAHVAGFAELSATRDALMQRLAAARRHAARRADREERARAGRERIIGDPEAHRWERVSNDDCGDPGCVETRAVPRFGPVGAIAGWWRVKVSSGCP